MTTGMPDDFDAAYGAFRPPSLLAFCTRCGQAVGPYQANESRLAGDHGLDVYSVPLAASGDPREALSTYECANCHARWVAASTGDTGLIATCGHFTPAHARFCAACGHEVFATS